MPLDLNHFAIDLRTLIAWSKIDELRLAANAVKHAEGSAAQRLRQVRPELFQHPLVRHLMPDMSTSVLPVRTPLAGDNLYMTEDLFDEYWQAANRIFLDIAGHFEAHGDEYYPARWLARLQY